MAIALTAGMRSNLIALQNVDSLMQTTQNRLSTGKKVNSALDDPVNFFKAEDHYNRASDLAAKKDGMGEAIKIIESANTGIEKIEDLLNQMKSLASAAKTSDQR
jgi:flagellin